ncbi:MAG: hypothetical protein CVU96_03840 [Firmicutes bacterium HGW-Firmicutes-20]|nr:MAG: hypothetical protein CVU96_03840 [Firmicutes bacterium HGW-Firmicutes-20]
MAIESAKYRSLKKEKDFEVRVYDEISLAMSKESDFRGYSGFNEAFDYISGSNDQNRKISMTTPVINELNQESMTMAFVMPSSIPFEELPNPKSQRLSMVKKENMIFASIRFSGTVCPTLLEKKKKELTEWMVANDLIPGSVIWLARYNPPFIPGFLKRNEVLISIENSMISEDKPAGI